MEETPKPKVIAPDQKPSGLVRLSLYISLAILGTAGLYFVGVHDACRCGYTAVDFGWAFGIFSASALATFASIEINISNGRRPAPALFVALIGLLFSFAFAIAVTLEDPHVDHRAKRILGEDSRVFQIW